MAKKGFKKYKIKVHLKPIEFEILTGSPGTLDDFIFEEAKRIIYNDPESFIGDAIVEEVN